jgi:membrane fusion protein, multidrug efflux system
MKRPLLSTAYCLLLLSSCSTPAPPPAERVFPVTVTSPKVQDVPIYLEYPGHIEAYNTVKLQSQVSADLTGMYFEEGTFVKEGQLLFTLDSRSYLADLAKAEADLEGSIAALKLAEDTVCRYSKLVEENFVAQLNYDQYVTTSLEDNASVKANKANVDAARINLSYCSLFAPMDAIAGKKEISVGNFVKAGEDTPLIILNQINPIYASFYAPDVDLPAIQRQQNKTGPLEVEVYLNGDKSEAFSGKLTLINNQVDQGTGSIFMKATLANMEKMLWPGEFVDVRIILSTLKNAILLPAAALQLGQNGYYAFVINKSMQAELRQVELGLRYGEEVAILKGIEPSDTVVLQGQVNLAPGYKVTITPTNTSSQNTGNHS